MAVRANDRHRIHLDGFDQLANLASRMIPSALIDSDSWSAISNRVDPIGQLASGTTYCLECRLQKPEADADLTIGMGCGSELAHLVLEYSQTQDSTLQFLSPFLNEWCRPDSYVAKNADFLALEYDFVEVEGVLPPRVFLRSDAGQIGFQRLDVLQQAISLITGWENFDGIMHAIARVFDAMSSTTGAINWFGDFVDGEPKTVRLLVRDLGIHTTEFLTRCGCSSTTETIQNIRQQFDDYGTHSVAVSLDVTEDQITPNLCLEISHGGNVDFDWTNTFDLLEAKLHCLPEKVEALRQLVSNERFYSPSGIWDVHCNLNHIKVLPASKTATIQESLEQKTLRIKAYIVCVGLFKG